MLIGHLIEIEAFDSSDIGFVLNIGLCCNDQLVIEILNLRVLGNYLRHMLCVLGSWFSSFPAYYS